eukprot:scaffold84848_cov71-Phaeocystis_antarctica.AAC.2
MKPNYLSFYLASKAVPSTVVSSSAARRKGVIPGAAAAHVRRGELLPVATISRRLAAREPRHGAVCSRVPRATRASACSARCGPGFCILRGSWGATQRTDRHR